MQVLNFKYDSSPNARSIRGLGWAVHTGIIRGLVSESRLTDTKLQYFNIKMWSIFLY